MKKSDYSFNELFYIKWKDKLRDKLILSPNPNGFFTNSKNEKCDNRDIVSHELNKYFNYILNYGKIFEKDHDIETLKKLVKYFYLLGEIQVVRKIIIAPEEDWNRVNNTIGIYNVLYQNNLCSKCAKTNNE
jgi:hypothetical protein